MLSRFIPADVSFSLNVLKQKAVVSSFGQILLVKSAGDELIVMNCSHIPNKISRSYIEKVDSQGDSHKTRQVYL